MAKRKRKEGAAPAGSQARVAPGETRAGSSVGQADATELFSVRQYVLLNVIFDGFCVVQLILCRVLPVVRETRGLYFFFALLMVGFFAVSVFDYVYDRLTLKSSAQTEI